MITVTGTFTVNKDKVPEVLLAAQSLQSASSTDEGCQEYKFHQSTDDAASFFVYEVWDDLQSLGKHAASAHFKNFEKVLDGILDVALDIQMYNNI
jgi:quinol monooxygenase YgiN